MRRRRCGDAPSPCCSTICGTTRFALWSVHEERPDLVEKYTEFLEAQYEAHQSLAQLFTRSGVEIALTPEQLRTLRALGYIQ